MSFYRGFMDGMNESRQQTERDTRLAMDIEGKRAALGQSMAQEGRARERMELERERAIRDARASDFDFEQKKGAAERDKQLRDEMTGIVNEFTVPREEVGPDGTKKTLPPLMSTPEGQLGMYTRFFKARSKAGLVTPAEMKQFQDFGKEVERSGLVDAAIRYSMGDKSGLAAIAKRAGVDPKQIDIKTEFDPKTQLATTKVFGIGPDDKPFSIDLAPAFAAWGANYDPDKATNDKARLASGIRRDDRVGEGALMQGEAARSRAASYGAYQRARTNALTGDGAGGGVDFTPKESKDFQAALSQASPKVPDKYRGLASNPNSVDEAGRELLRTFGIDNFQRSASSGKRPSVQTTMESAYADLQKANDQTTRLLPQLRFVRDPSTRQVRLATKEEYPTALIFDRVPSDQKMDAFVQARRYVVDAAKRKRQEAETKAAESARQRALDSSDE